MKTVFCKKGSYLFGEFGEKDRESVSIQALAFVLPWRGDNDIFRNQYEVQTVADLIERVYIYEKCFGGDKHYEFLHCEGARIKEYSHECLMERKKEIERYIGTFNRSIDTEPNFVVFDRQPWKIEVHSEFNSCTDYLKMARRIGAKNFEELPDLTKIDEDGG